MRSGNALYDPGLATTIRKRGGKVMTTDGPFAETKEQLIGYYLIDCADLDAAMAYAADLPSAGTGSTCTRCCSFISPSRTASGRGGQPGTYTSTGTIVSMPWTVA